MRSMVTDLFAIILGIVVIVSHGRVAKVQQGLGIRIREYVRKRFPLRPSRWQLVGPLWLYRLPWLIMGFGLIAVGIMSIAQKFWRGG